VDYKNENAQVMFQVTEQTVRNWSAEFVKYLSPTANPEKGATRLFTRDDMMVFSLIAEMRGQGKKYDAIGVALENGQRGGLSDLSDDALVELSSSEHGIVLANENRELKLKIMDLEATIDANQEKSIEYIRLEAQLKELRRQHENSEHRFVEAMKSAQQSYAQGFKDGAGFSGKKSDA